MRGYGGALPLGFAPASTRQMALAAPASTRQTCRAGLDHGYRR